MHPPDIGYCQLEVRNGNIYGGASASVVYIFREEKEWAR